MYSESNVLFHLVLAMSRSFSPGHLRFQKQHQVLKYVFIHAVNILPLTDNQTYELIRLLTILEGDCINTVLNAGPPHKTQV